MATNSHKTQKQLLAELDRLKQELAEIMKIEKALRESEEEYKGLYDNSPLPYQSLNEDGSFRDVNPTWLKVLGYTRDEVIGKSLADFLHPKWKSYFKKNFSAFKKRGYLHDTQFKMRHKDGYYIDTLLEGRIGYYPDGSFKQTYCVFRDITEQKRAEEKIEHLSRIFEDSLNEIYLFDAESLKFNQANKAAQQNLGYSMEELLEMTPLTIKPELTEELFLKIVAPLRSGKKKMVVFETIHKRKNKTLYNVEVHLQLLHFENEDMFAAIILDITERKKVEEKLRASNQQLFVSEQQLRAANQQLEANEQQLRAANQQLEANEQQLRAANQQLEATNQQLRESERKFHELFEKSGDPILILENRRFVDCNSATIKLLNYNSKREFLNTHPSEISPIYQPDGRLSYEKAEEMIDKALEKRTHRFEWEHLKSDGEIIPVEVLLTAISSEKGKEIIHTVWRDITERKTAEKKIVDALEKAQESDRLKTAFLANMSHEIRTPMNGIIGFTNLLDDPDLTNTDRQKYTAIINKSSDRLLSTINDLIDISKIEAGQMKVSITEIAINKLLDELYGFFKPEATLKGLSLVSLPTLPDNEAIVLSDDAKLHGILTNLIKNAIKFTKKGGITFGYYLKDDFIEFFVEDTGIGVPENRRQAIFNRFEQADIEDTRAFEGSGLGLTISKAYVEMLGGKIWLSSEEGKGSSFMFTIPCNTKTGRKVESAAKVIEKLRKEMVINNRELLIVEDEETSSLFLETILKNRFRKITSVKTGREAIEVCRSNPQIDIVLMDLKMPEMSGYETTREIRKFNKEVVIIAQTAFALAGDREKAIEAGCDDYIPKPIDKQLLLEMINNHLEKKEGI